MKKGWQKKPLGELAQIELGKTPSRARVDFWDDKRITCNVWLSIADLLNAEDNLVVDSKEYVSNAGAAMCKLVPKGTLLVSFKLTLGRLAFAGRDLYTNEAIAALTLFNERELSKEFLFWFLHFFDWVKAAENDVKLKGMTLNKAKLKALEVHYPKTLTEQKRIVAILDKAFDGIAKAKAYAEKNLQNARALFESYLNEVFSKKGDGWEERRLGDLSERITKGSSPKWQGISYVNSPGILFVTSENVGENKIIIDKPKYVEERFNIKDKKSILQYGDVLTNIVGASIGRTAVFNLDVVANINQAVCLIRCKPSILSNYYLSYLLNSPVLKQILHDNEVNNARANLSLGFFTKLRIPIPPIQKQLEIVTRFDEFQAETQRLQSIYKRKLTELEELKKSLLHQAFNGQL